MALKKLTVETLHELDFGSIGIAFQKHLARVVQDCIDRPGDKRARTVLLEMKVVPVVEIRGSTIDCEGAKGTFKLKSKVPDHETQELDFAVRHDGSLVFNEESPRNHRQGVMFPQAQQPQGENEDADRSDSEDCSPSR
jgi:hypothetical protein